MIRAGDRIIDETPTCGWAFLLEWPNRRKLSKTHFDEERTTMQILEKLKPVALLLLRIALGIIFVYHGYPKLFTHTREALEAFPRMGFPSYFVYVAGVIEFFGGCLLFLGLFTRIAALLLAGEMAVAIIRVHLPQGGPLAVSNYQLPLALAVAAFALATEGAGAISFDRAVFKSKA